MLRRAVFVLMLLTSAFSLSACDSAKQRAQQHYLAGLALLKSGDVDRAMIEFRNVFKLDGTNHDARATYAKLLRDRGDLHESYSQYLRLVEQYPDDIDGNRALAEIALETANFDDAQKYATIAAKLAPEDADIKAILLTLQYKEALRKGDEATRKSLADSATALVAAAPKATQARQLVIDNLLRAQDWPAALTQIDEGIAQTPLERSYYQLRLGVLGEMKDKAAIEAQLKSMLTVFPKDPTIPTALVSWYISENNLDAAETFLRSRIDAKSADNTPRLALLQFLTLHRGRDVAKAELERLIASTDTPDKTVLKSLHAAFAFEDGDHKAAIAELQTLVADAPADAKTNAIKVALARMLAADGDQAAASKTIDDVLKADAGQIDAMKLKAGWLIDADNTGEALVVLRDALGQSPQDPALMTLMARAYERDGNRNLEADALLQAVNASNHAVPESLQYAGFLMNDAKYSSAESVLIDAVRVSPTNPDLLSALARTHLAMKDWTRASQDIDTLRALNTATTTDTANQLQVQLLQAQSRGDDLTAFLSNLANSGASSISADIALIRAQAQRGDLAGALTRSADLAAKNPDSAAAQLIHASVLGAMGRTEEEEPILRTMIAKDPKQEAVWNELYRLTLAKGDASASTTVLADALTALPDNADLLWTKAGVLEKSGDVEGAIAIYEGLYAKHSDSEIIANNLASLLATARSDDASLQRAFTVARRLRDSKQPAFQDTYGWISYRLGDYDTAALSLKAAATGLPHDPAVQYHLAAAYAAQHQDAAALAQYKLAAQLIDPAHPPAFKTQLDAEIARLTAVTK